METRARALQLFIRRATLHIAGKPSREIDVEPIVIGRNEGADVVLEDNEVSGVHCELRAVSEGIQVRDLGSTNGTFCGPVRIREAIIADRAELTVGTSRLVLEPAGKKRVDLGYSDRFGSIVGATPNMRRVFSTLEKISATELSVLVLGETGTGKEGVARSIHDASLRKQGPFMVVDCASIPPTLAESILFGHEKGAFTGANERRDGALSEANSGTLFLDELGELPIDLQPKLLRALAERQVKRVGGTSFEPIDVRLVAATRRDLSSEMNAGRFRSDLYFRIAQVRLEIPALRERLADLPLLVEEICRRMGRPKAASVVHDWIERRMSAHDWPGNVRELVNVVSVAATLADTPEAIDDVLLLRQDAEPEQSTQLATAFSEAKRRALTAFERNYFIDLNKRAKGNVSEMARRSGMERHHVRAYLRKYGLDKGSV
ncbi:MAG TPA: sigma 54-interacting transcriptional regulator [Kofleriaceae bacterium]|nr:sigma 54-interacting transcriptional regulator [Kofleriaceae bacterium]